MLMGMLAAGGCPVLVDGARLPDGSNPRGYFEYAPVKRLHVDAGWLLEARGKAVKIVSRFLEFLPVGHRYQVVFMTRCLEEVLDSQAAMLGIGRGMDAEAGAMRGVFEKHLAAVEALLGAREDVSVLRLRHNEVVRGPASTAAVVAAFLGRDLDLGAMAAAVDPALYRQRGISA